MNLINPPYPVFTDVDGQPLEDGYIYIGVANLNPETNPISVFYDEAGLYPAAQPIRTTGGYAFRTGTPTRLYANSDFSIRVKNKNGTLVYSSNSQISATQASWQAVDTLTQLRALDKTKVAHAFFTGDSTGSKPGNYFYDAADTTTADDGYTVIVGSDGGRWKLWDVPLQENSGNGITSLRNASVSVVVLGDSISEGVGASNYMLGYSYILGRSIMNACNQGFPYDPSYGYHSIVNMANALSETGVSTTGSVIGGGVVGSRLSLAAGQTLTVTGKEIAYLDFIYDASSSSGALQYKRNGVVIATKTISGTGYQNTFATTLNNGNIIPASDTITVTSTTGTVVITAILALKQSSGTPITYVVAKSGTAYQDYTGAAALDELAAYMSFSRSSHMVVLALGTNNIYNSGKALSPAGVVTQIAALITGLNSRAGAGTYWAISIPPKASNAWPVSIAGYTYEDYVRAIAAYAVTVNAVLIRNDLSVLSRDADYYSDGVHPNDIGHQVMAKTFCDVLGVPQNSFRPDSTTTLGFLKGKIVPTIVGKTTAGTGTYTVQSGDYTKIGNVVYFSIQLGWTAHTGTGDLRVAGLPFVAQTDRLQPVSVFSDGLLFGAGKQLQAMVATDVGNQVAFLAADPTGGASTFVAIDTAVTQLTLSGMYFIN